MTIDDLLASPSCDLASPIALVVQGEFRWGRCQAILYDPRRSDAASLFPQPWLYTLYEKSRLSGLRHPIPLDLQNRASLGPLPTLFCGMTNLGPDAVCAYLAQRAVCVVGEWRPETYKATISSEGGTIRGDWQEMSVRYDPESEKFHPLGYCFPSTTPTTSPLSLTGQPSNSVFAGYTIFSEAWRTPQQLVLMYLGLAWLFHTFSLAALHGSRLATNHLTARWTRQFGFRDRGELPACMMGEPGGALVVGVFSTLLREDFEARLREVLEKVRAQASTPAPFPPAS